MRNSLKIFHTLALACALGSETCYAQTPQETTAALLAFTATGDHRAAVMTAVRPYFTAIPSCIPGTAKRITLQVILPVSFDAAGTFVSGLVQEGVKVDGCTTSGLFNVLTMARDGASVRVGATLPGTTHASFILQRDALPTALGVTAAKIGGGCKDLAAIDTRFDGFGDVADPDVQPGRDPRSWRETWTFTGCGQLPTITMKFIPDRTGTSFTAEP